MTSRLNVKVILIVLTVLIACFGTAGGLWYLQVRTNPQRNIQTGDEAMKAGDLDVAIKYYGRAVAKEPANLEYLNTLQQALLQVRPRTAEEARDRYGMLLGLLKQKADHYPTDAEAHLAFIRELHNNARLLETVFGTRNGWNDVRDAAETMWANVPATNDQRIKSKLYSGMATLRLAARLTDAEVSKGERDLEAYLDQHPDDELGWAALIHGRMLLAEHIEQTSTQQQAQEKWQQVQDDLDQALEETPDGPHVSYVRAMYVTWQKMRNDASVPLEQFHRRLEQLVDLAPQADDPWLLIEAAKILRFAPRMDGPQKAIALLNSQLDSNPDAYAHQLILARMHLETDAYEKARETAEQIINAEAQKLSFLSQMQFDLRRHAAAVVVDVEFERWRMAEQTDEQQQRLDELQAATQQLSELSSGSQNDRLLAQAEARVAFANQEYQKASTILQRLINQGAGDFDTHRLAAISLKNANQPGLAYERIKTALRMRPTHLGMLHEKARLELEMQRPEDAADTIEQGLELYPGNSALEALASQVERKREQQSFELENPDVIRLAQAQRQLDAGNIDAARETLLEALNQSDHRLQFLVALIRLEMSAGNTPEAQQYLKQALEVDPNNQALQRLSLMLEHEDPVEAMRQYIANAPGSEASRAVETAISMGQLARSREQLAQTFEQAGQREQAEAARQVAQRARKHEQEALQQANELSPDDPRLIEYQFGQAIEQQDWSKAEQLAQRAAEIDADQADGLMYRGRIALARQNWEQAARTLEDAVSRNSVLGEAWRGLAFAYQNLGNYPEALRAYEEAYRRNPAESAVVKAYCSLLRQVGDIPRALRIARESRGLANRDLEFRELWLELEASQGDRALALQRRREIYENVPSDERNAKALVSLLIDLQPRRSLLLAENGEPRFSTSQWGRMNAATQQQHLRQAVADWHAEAGRILDELEQTRGESLELVLLRARLLRARGNPQQGETVLRQYIEGFEDSPEKARMMIVLAEFQRESDRHSAAAETLQQALPYQGDNRPVDSALGSLYFSRNDYEKALEHYERCVEVTPNRNVALRSIECLIRLDQFDEAEQRLQEMKSQRGNDLTLTLLEASMLSGRAEQLYEQGDIEAAQVKMQENEAVLNVAKQINPQSPLPHIQRADALLAQYRHTNDGQLLNEALQAVDRAESVQASNRPAALLRVRILREKGDSQRLISALTEFVESNPDDQQFRQMLIRTHAEMGNREAAINVARNGVQREPQNPLWYGVLGDLYAQNEQDRAEAMQAYLQAYELAGIPNAISQYMALANERPLAPGSFDFSRAIQALGQYREQVENNPLMRTMLAQMLYVQERRTEAMQQLKVAYRTIDAYVSDDGDIRALDQWIGTARRMFRHEDPQIAEQNLRTLFGDSPRPRELQLIAGLWTQSGQQGYSRAEEILRNAISATSPNDDQALVGQLHRDLGTILHQVGKSDEAVEAYEKAMQYIEEDPFLLNNLAYILTERLDEPKEALPYAERAVELLPDNAMVLDTLGWTQFKAGDVENAEQTLRKSLQQKATPGTHLRLARLLVDTNRTEQAMSHLRQAEQLGPDAATQTEIEQLLDDIRTKASADR